jgi:hypothetical protein
MELKTDDNGIQYYLIPKGTMLYRGDSEHTGETMRLDDRITFFGFDQENVEGNYGITYEFTTKKQLKLLAVDKNNSEIFIDLIEENSVPNKYHEIIDILNKNYGYKSGLRDSDAKKDMILSDFICKNLNYDGYACDEMPTQTGFLHREAMICSPKKLFEGDGKRVTSSDKIGILHEEWKLLQRKREMEERRKDAKNKNKLSLFSRYDEGRTNLFGSDDEEESRKVNLFSDHFKENDDYELPQGRSLFGGKRKTKRRQRKTKRRGKRKKTYKKRR